MVPQPLGTVGVGGSRRQWGAKGRRRDGVGTAQPRASEDGHSPEPELPTGGKGSVPTACYTNTMPTTQWPGPGQCGSRGKPPTSVLDSVQVDSEGTPQVRPDSGGPGRGARPSLHLPRQRKQQTRRLWAPHSQPRRPAAGRGPPSACPAWAAQAPLLLEGEQSFSPGHAPPGAPPGSPGISTNLRVAVLPGTWAHTPG